MNLPGGITNTLGRIFDEGLDEVLVFTFIFIFVLLSGHSNEGSENDTINFGILPLILIGAFLLLYSGFGRAENGQGQAYDPM